MVVRWLVMGLPAIALWAWGHPSWAADGALDFTLTAPIGAAASPLATTAVAPPVAPPALDPGPNLAFSPPRVWSPGALAAAAPPSGPEQVKPRPLGRESPAAGTALSANGPVPSGPVPNSSVPNSSVPNAPAPKGSAPRTQPGAPRELPPPVSTTPAPLSVPPGPIPVTSADTDPAIAPPPMAPLPPALAEIFLGGSESIAARIVGSAEGTRTVTGQRTAAYFGHRDPGNGAWNLGSFSYQHGAANPEEADRRQLQRLQVQTHHLLQQAQAHGLTLTWQEWLNGIDLANQAPAAALDRGYVPWLAQARQLRLPEAEAILWARTRAFLDPDTGRWNAPGLGNQVATISADQARRQRAIAATLPHLTRPDTPLPTTPTPAAQFP